MTNNQNSLAGKISLLSFFFEARDEIKKVTWPTRQQLVRLTIVVIGSSVALAAYLGALDYVFINILGFILNK